MVRVEHGTALSRRWEVSKCSTQMLRVDAKLKTRHAGIEFWCPQWYASGFMSPSWNPTGIIHQNYHSQGSCFVQEEAQPCCPSRLSLTADSFLVVYDKVLLCAFSTTPELLRWPMLRLKCPRMKWMRLSETRGKRGTQKVCSYETGCSSSPC